jgi:hypothetical protein
MPLALAGGYTLWQHSRPWIRVGSQPFASWPIFPRRSSTSSRRRCARPRRSRVPKSSPSTTAIYFIEQGEAEVLSEGGEATKVLGPGDAFGEISLVLTGQRTATVVARTPLGCSRSADRTSSASESACPSWNARYAASVSSGRRGSTRPEMIESERADEASPRELRLAGPVRGNVTRAWRIICDRDRLAGRGPRRCPLVTRGGRAGSPRPAIVSCRREDLRNALERRADERDARRGRHPHGNRQRSPRLRAGPVGQEAGCSWRHPLPC